MEIKNKNMNGKEIDEAGKEISDFLKELNVFVDESEKMTNEYWGKRNKKGYLIEKKDNLINITPELIKRAGCVEVVL